jgi:hypothetical protein
LLSYEVTDDAELLAYIFLNGAEVADEDSVVFGPSHEKAGLGDPQSSQLYIHSILLPDLQLFLILAISGQSFRLDSKAGEVLHNFVLSEPTGIISDLDVVVLHLQPIILSLLEKGASLLKGSQLWLLGAEVVEFNAYDSAVEVYAIVN